MTSSNAHFYPTVDKPRRMSPDGSQKSHGVFFQTWGGEHLSLFSDFTPTLRSPDLFFPHNLTAPSTQNAALLNTVPGNSDRYAQPRASLNKLGCDLNPQVLYDAYPATGDCEQTFIYIFL